MSFSIKSFYNWYRSTIRNPKYRWLMILGTLAYLFSPIDIAPDFIPIIGQVDDIMVLTLLISELSQLTLDYAKSRKENVASEEQAQGDRATIEVDAVSVK